MVASMPMPMVNARNPNRKSVILPMGPPLIDRFAVQVKTPAFKVRVRIGRSLDVGSILEGWAVSVQIQVDVKNTDQMNI
jgi:hypothetical protein